MPASIVPTSTRTKALAPLQPPSTTGTVIPTHLSTLSPLAEPFTPGVPWGMHKYFRASNHTSNPASVHKFLADEKARMVRARQAREKIEQDRQKRERKARAVLKEMQLKAWEEERRARAGHVSEGSECAAREGDGGEEDVAKGKKRAARRRRRANAAARRKPGKAEKAAGEKSVEADGRDTPPAASPPPTVHPPSIPPPSIPSIPPSPTSSFELLDPPPTLEAISAPTPEAFQAIRHFEAGPPTHDPIVPALDSPVSSDGGLAAMEGGWELTYDMEFEMDLFEIFAEC
ncbi:hypothetical protein EJ06DRAFT_550432 [Trichodelitschia bisporula]|uniref:Uncharacterized protein n=1 Tax=Trichodelitschia bisporula TaxID=703511 RepID=A0A6G1HRQ1_9PEZI|nr:hypothetical protein EJ06DRAFT_550432 [Trichodelitschia bisporula]